jgi:pimeloyl-ACP methyl ester carboxylesterase
MFDKDRTRMLQFKDWSDKDLMSIKAPALIIAGDKDVVTVQHTAEMQHLVPGAELMILPGGHGTYIGEICAAKKDSKIPGLTVEVIEEFLNK